MEGPTWIQAVMKVCFLVGILAFGTYALVQLWRDK